MRTIDRLAVARRAHELTLEIYSLTKGFPSDERFGLVSQLRRAAVAIGSNIVEGDSGNSNAEFARYLEVAKASAGEVEYQLLLAKDLGYVDPEAHQLLEAEVGEIRAMLVGFIRRLRKADRVKSGPIPNPDRWRAPEPRS